jgi:hypothetical protein
MTMIISGSDGLEFPDGSDQTTAVPAPGTVGNILQSNGTIWTSAANPPAFVAGTRVLFQQTAAPTGWTKDTTHDNKALRVVSGTVGSGGSVAFTTAFASQAVAGSISVGVSAGTLAVSAGSLGVGSTTLSTSQIPAHGHTQRRASTGGGNQEAANVGVAGSLDSYLVTADAGGGGSHNHSISGSPSLSGSPSITSSSFTGTAINLAVSYVDLIIASKD